MSAGDLQPRILLTQPFSRQLRHAGFGTQQIDGPAFFCQFSHQPHGKFNAGNFSFQRRPQHGCTLDDADTVRQYQIRMIDNVHHRRVRPTDLYNLGIGGDHVMGTGGADQVHPGLHRFFQCQVVEPDAQHVDTHIKHLATYSYSL